MTYRVRKSESKWVILNDDNEISGLFGFKANADKVCKNLNKPKKRNKKKSEK